MLYLLRIIEISSCIGNVCVGDPCGSNGRCVEDGNSFKCICNSLFTGPRCRTRESFQLLHTASYFMLHFSVQSFMSIKIGLTFLY